MNPFLGGGGQIDDAIGNIRVNPKPLACYLFTASSSPLPFGGVGNSGTGRYHRRAGFDLFSNLNGVVRLWPSLALPLRYAPYGQGASQVVEAVSRGLEKGYPLG